MLGEKECVKMFVFGDVESKRVKLLNYKRICKTTNKSIPTRTLSFQINNVRVRLIEIVLQKILIRI